VTTDVLQQVVDAELRSDWYGKQPMRVTGFTTAQAR
jgi:hypothetical protein